MFPFVSLNVNASDLVMNENARHFVFVFVYTHYLSMQINLWLKKLSVSRLSSVSPSVNIWAVCFYMDSRVSDPRRQQLDRHDLPDPSSLEVSKRWTKPIPEWGSLEVFLISLRSILHRMWWRATGFLQPLTMTSFIKSPLLGSTLF